MSTSELKKNIANLDFVEEMDSLKIFGEFLKLAAFYPVEQCENMDCSNCLFIVNLRYLHVEHKENQTE